MLLRANLYPLGDLMSSVSVRRIEETLRQNPFVESAECYKTQTGRVIIQLVQRQPVVRVKADNGDDYYLDEHGNVMASTMQVSDLVVATGHISKAYAKKSLTPIGIFLLEHPLWRSQVEQLNVMEDGTVEMIPRVGDHIIYLGTPTHLDKKLARLEKFYRYGLSKAGWNKYTRISIEFDNQIICKRRNKSKKV
jgi:cell division protein FtsQ